MITAQNAAILGTYVVCLDCGKEFAYDWKTMRVGEQVVARSAAAPSVAVPQAQPMFR